MLMGRADAKMAKWLGSAVPAELVAHGRLRVREGLYEAQALATALSAADGVWVGYAGHFGSSGVLWNAVLAELPVLGRDTGLIAWDIRANDIGLTVDIHDSRAVANALAELLTDETGRARWKCNALRVGPLHTADAFGNVVVNALSDAVETAGTPVTGERATGLQ
jgi:glycosyltransferase involved in cell wall biosynthesis